MDELHKTSKVKMGLKIIHTADWHIGQTFYDYDRKNEHNLFFAWLKELLKQEAIDLLLIAGDVFDTPNPSAESQRLFYHFLQEVTNQNNDLQIVIIAGNHDSAGRLEAPIPLLEAMNIWVKGTVKRDLEGKIDFKQFIIPILQKNSTVGYCMALPYLRQGDLLECENFSQGVSKMYSSVLEEINALKSADMPIIALGHLQATGSEIMEGDRAERTTIGGLDCISPDAFDAQITYTALGHLHKAQQVSKRENVRYSGTPLPMSFAEKHYKHGVTLVETEASKAIRIERIPFEAPVKLLSIPAEPRPLKEVLSEIEKLPDGDKTEFSPYLEVKVLITEPEPSLRHQLEEKLKYKAIRLARMVAVSPKQTSQDEVPISFEEFKAINPLEMAKSHFKNIHSNEMPPKMEKLLTTVIEEVIR